jgi:PAS domain-containing protein
VGTIAQFRDGDVAQAEDRLRGAFALAERAVQIGYWRYDLNTHTHFWSPGMYALMGVDLSVAPQTGWLRDHLPIAEQVHVAEVIGEAIRTRAPFFCLTVLRRSWMPRAKWNWTTAATRSP